MISQFKKGKKKYRYQGMDAIEKATEDTEPQKGLLKWNGFTMFSGWRHVFWLSFSFVWVFVLFHFADKEADKVITRSKQCAANTFVLGGVVSVLSNMKSKEKRKKAADQLKEQMVQQKRHS